MVASHARVPCVCRIPVCFKPAVCGRSAGSHDSPMHCHFVAGNSTALPGGFDAVEEYEQASGGQLNTVGAAAQRDPLIGQPAAQAARRRLTRPICGLTLREGWEHLVAGRLGPFVRAFVVYLSCV